METIRVYVGTKSALFKPPDYSHLPQYGWYIAAGLIYWLSDVQRERYKNVGQDLASISEYLRLHIDKLLDLFKYPDEFDKKL
jgi:hypothetical protein